jgi:hypothetical protein
MPLQRTGQRLRRAEGDQFRDGGTSDATGCGLAPITALPAGFSYQTTAAGTNALTGSPNTPATIPAGGY